MAELTLAQVYRQADKLIGERGWFQGYLCSPDGRLCLLGAICVAIGRPVPNPHWRAAPIDAIRLWDAAYAELVVLLDETPSAWNDAPARTVAEVRAALLRAAEEAERRG